MREGNYDTRKDMPLAVSGMAAAFRCAGEPTWLGAIVTTSRACTTMSSRAASERPSHS
jgi:hypothetical protein